MLFLKIIGWSLIARRHNQWRANTLKNFNGKIKQWTTLVKTVTRSGRRGNPPRLVTPPITPPNRVTSPTEDPPPPLSKKALKWSIYSKLNTTGAVIKGKLCFYVFFPICSSRKYPYPPGHFCFRPLTPPAISIPGGVCQTPQPPGSTISAKNAVALYYYAKRDCSCDKLW